MAVRADTKTEVWRLIIFRRDASELLVCENEKRLRLPRLDIPERTRVAHALNARIKAIWDMDVFCLYPLAPSTAFPNDLLPPCHVIEAHPLAAAAPEGSTWLPIFALLEVTFADPADLAAIAQWRSDLIELVSNRNHTPLGSPRCLEHLQTWVRAALQPFGLRLRKQFVQFNASKSFNLTRFETDGDAVWFKATGEPNIRELAISRGLAQLFPDLVPRVLSTREDWNAWLSLDVCGTHPDGDSEIKIWTDVASTLANLQIASIGNVLHLIDIGCKNARARTLIPLVEPFLDAMGRLTDQQVKPIASSVSQQDLAALGVQLKDLLSDHENVDIPDTLGHFDFNPGNIVVSGKRIVFLDWAEAFVGHPFLTLRYLAEYMRRLFPSASCWESHLTSAYLKPWRCWLGPREISRALAVSPFLAIAAYALSLRAWRDATQCADPQTARYLRSLTRRMKREAASWAVQKFQRASTSPPSIAEVSACHFSS